MSEKKMGKRATVSEEPRAWAEIHPERRGWVRAVIRKVLAEERIPRYAPGLAIIRAERIEALCAALALLSEPVSSPPSKPPRRPPTR